MTAEDLAQSGVDGAESRREIFPTLADGISAAPAPSDSEERLAALRRMSVMLAAAYLAAFGLAVAARGRFPEDAIFWCWSVATAVLFILGMTLWQSLMREDRIKARRIRDRDQRYRQTLALLPEGVVILGEGWRVEWVNARALEHLSLGPGCAGRSFFDSVHDEGLRRWLIERNFSGRFALEVPDGRRLEVAVVAPDARHMMIVTHDSTERMRLDDMRRDFVANVSHELRTPLTVISGFLELESAPGSVPPETLARHRELMYEQARRMKSLLDDLLLLSSLENRDEHPDEDAEVIAMPRLIEDVAREGRAACLAGSSLGGFLALRAAGRRRIPCVAVNPCLDPWTHVPALTGEQRVFGTDRVLRVEASFADDFRALEAEAPAAPADPADALIVLSTADEVLDWRAAAGALSASPRILSVGDDHRMERFDACLEPVFAFLARRLRARDRAQ